MNGQALQKEFGGLSAKAMFKKLNWLLPERLPSTSSTSKKGNYSSRTNELVVKWKAKSLPKHICKKGHSEKTFREKPNEKPNDDDENEDVFLEKQPSEKRKKI